MWAGSESWTGQPRSPVKTIQRPSRPFLIIYPETVVPTVPTTCSYPSTTGVKTRKWPGMMWDAPKGNVPLDVAVAPICLLPCKLTNRCLTWVSPCPKEPSPSSRVPVLQHHLTLKLPQRDPKCLKSVVM